MTAKSSLCSVIARALGLICNARKPCANRFRLIKMAVDVDRHPADGESQAAELRNDAEHRLVGSVVADEDRIALRERCAPHQFADGIGLADAARLDLDDEFAGQYLDGARR